MSEVDLSWMKFHGLCRGPGVHPETLSRRTRGWVWLPAVRKSTLSPTICPPPLLLPVLLGFTTKPLHSCSPESLSQSSLVGLVLIIKSFPRRGTFPLKPLRSSWETNSVPTLPVTTVNHLLPVPKTWVRKVTFCTG